MQVITPEASDMRAIQQRDGAFYFSGCFDAVLMQNGIVAAHPEPLGPGIVTREFPDPNALDPARPYVFEGPLSEELIASDGLDVETLEAEQLMLYDAEHTAFSNLCYQTITVRWIPPVGSKANPEMLPFKPKDPRWRQDSFKFQKFDVSDGVRPILYAELSDGERIVVGVQKANRIYLGVPVLGILVQHLVCPPVYDTSFCVNDKHIVPYYVWNWLHKIVRDMAFQTGWLYARVSPWPAGKEAAFCIRHDFDRPAKLDELKDLLEFYAAHGVKSTWFWRLCQAEDELFDLVSRHGHELALHTEREGRTGFIEEELGTFAAQFGLDLRGYSAHGGRGTCGCLGQRQFKWAAQAGLEYGELLSVDNELPVPCVLVNDDLPEITDLWLPGTHYSIDRGTAPDAYDLDRPREYADRRAKHGGQIVIMNHPDIHLEPLKKFVAETDFENVWHATLLESVRWCRQRCGLSATRSNKGEIVLLQDGPLDHAVEVWLEGVGENVEAERRVLSADFRRAVIHPDAHSGLAAE